MLCNLPFDLDRTCRFCEHIPYPPIAAMRLTTHVIYALRVIPRRPASVSINSATPSSSVKPARTLFPESRISDIETN